MWIDPPKQTAAATLSENMPLDELVVDEVVEGDKLKIFVDLYFWFAGHLIELYVSIPESLGLRETSLKSYMKRVRWTCVRLSETNFFVCKWLIELRRFAVAVFTMSFTTSSSLAMLKLYKSIWIIQTRYLPHPHAVQIRLFRMTLNSDPAHDRFERSKNLGINFGRRRQTESTYDEIRNRDLDILARQCTQAYTLWLPPCACKTTRRGEEFHISAFDIFNRKNTGH